MPGRTIRIGTFAERDDHGDLARRDRHDTAAGRSDRHDTASRGSGGPGVRGSAALKGLPRSVAVQVLRVLGCALGKVTMAKPASV